jgi:acetyltransferase-like isoleucine patch superfamily enzyme
MGRAIISENADIESDVIIKDGAIIEGDVKIGRGSYIDYGAIIKSNTSLGERCFIGAYCILGEFIQDFFVDQINKKHPLILGNDAVIRSGTIVYGDTNVGDFFQTGHRATIREFTEIGDHVSVGTLSDLQGKCKIGSHVHLHSNVHIGQLTIINDYVWIFPYVVTTNDPTPPSGDLQGVNIEEYACVCTGSIILPGKRIGKDSLVGAGSIVTKDVEARAVVVGNPAKFICNVEEIKDIRGGTHYPWRDYYNRNDDRSGCRQPRERF